MHVTSEGEGGKDASNTKGYLPIVLRKLDVPKIEVTSVITHTAGSAPLTAADAEAAKPAKRTETKSANATWADRVAIGLGLAFVVVIWFLAQGFPSFF